jgi:hypothetical protein
MAKVRVPLYGVGQQRVATVDTEATPGAVVGVNLRNPDGSLFVPYTGEATPPDAGIALDDVQALADAPLTVAGSLAEGAVAYGWAGTTSNVPEGSRLYFTDPRVYAAVKAMLAGSALVSIVADDASQTVTIETKSFEFDQPTPSNEWSIAHNLGKFPTVAVTDSSGNAGIGSVRYVDANNLILSFGAPFAGTAYLN